MENPIASLKRHFTSIIEKLDQFEKENVYNSHRISELHSFIKKLYPYIDNCFWHLFYNEFSLTKGKDLNQVTKSDAVKIISASYRDFFADHKWSLHDVSKLKEEPCKRLWSKTSPYEFLFFHNAIDVNSKDFNEVENCHLFIHHSCYFRANKLGYKTPKF